MNNLYPIFLKVNELNILLVGGGNVGTGKLELLLKSSPKGQVTAVSREFSQSFIDLA